MMSTQLGLWQPARGGRCVADTRSSHCRQTIQERFEAFHGANPHVFAAFRRFAQEALAAGQHVGAKAIWERMRWHLAIETRGDSFKLNNNFTSRYARLLERTDPRFAGFFETRRLRDA